MTIQLAAFICSILLIVIGIIAIIFFDNLIKKVLGLMFLSDGVNLALIAIAYVEDGTVPIFRDVFPTINDYLGANPAYPLAQALVLTNIVIAVSIMAVCAGLIIKLYQRKKTLNASEILDEGDE